MQLILQRYNLYLITSVGVCPFLLTSPKTSSDSTALALYSNHSILNVLHTDFCKADDLNDLSLGLVNHTMRIYSLSFLKKKF